MSWGYQRPIFPSGVECEVVFVYDRTLRQYNTGNFTPTLVDFRVQENDVNLVLSRIEGICANYWNSILKSNIQKVLNIIMTSLIIIAIIIGAIVPLYTDHYQVIFLATFGILFISEMLILCYRSRKLKQIKDMMHQAKLDTMAFLNDINISLQTRGLRWVLPPAFPAVLELSKDYLKQPLSFPVSNRAAPPIMTATLAQPQVVSNNPNYNLNNDSVFVDLNSSYSNNSYLQNTSSQKFR